MVASVNVLSPPPIVNHGSRAGRITRTHDAGAGTRARPGHPPASEVSFGRRPRQTKKSEQHRHKQHQDQRTGPACLRNRKQHSWQDQPARQDRDDDLCKYNAECPHLTSYVPYPLKGMPPLQPMNQAIAASDRTA